MLIGQGDAWRPGKATGADRARRRVLTGQADAWRPGKPMRDDRAGRRVLTGQADVTTGWAWSALVLYRA
ncbi:hypothetical protein [Streptomyces sp. TRM70350]|uniref:hypothetical protein n=1 Tax=Streptomyces sp. TRM70350 TaxID=2856165 RepID=UPI001C453321|nr:hypothetical protein [Streptomyces sp. TRM70350]MBV7695670.1 hypothetical protein [Streptomyces sp. TRM70350]